MLAFNKKVFFCTLLLFLSFDVLRPSQAFAELMIDCVFDKYKNSGYPIQQAKSWLPPDQSHVLQDNKTAKHVTFGLLGTVTQNNSKKVKFSYKGDSGSTKYILKYEYHKTNKKIAGQVLFPGYIPMKFIWGTCEETEVKGEEIVQTSGVSDKELCGEVFLAVGEQIYSVTLTDADGNALYEAWIKEAESRWGKNYPDTKMEYCSSLLLPKTASSNTSSSGDKISGYKSLCTELGFTPGTEKHGECVLKMMEQ